MTSVGRVTAAYLPAAGIVVAVLAALTQWWGLSLWGAAEVYVLVVAADALERAWRRGVEAAEIEDQ